MSDTESEERAPQFLVLEDTSKSAIQAKIHANARPGAEVTGLAVWRVEAVTNYAVILKNPA